MTNNNCFFSSLVVKAGVQYLLSRVYSQILLVQAQRDIPRNTLSQMHKSVDSHLQLMGFNQNNQIQFKQTQQTSRMNPDNYANGVKIIQAPEIKTSQDNKTSYYKNRSNFKNQKASQTLNYYNKVKSVSVDKSLQQDNKQILPKTKFNKKTRISKSQKFIQILTSSQIQEQNNSVSRDEALRQLLDQNRKNNISNQLSKKQNRFKIIKRQNQIKQKYKNLHQFSYHYDGIPITVKQSCKDFMTNRQDFIQMKKNVLKKVVKRKRKQMLNQTQEQQVNYQYQVKGKNVNDTSIKTKKTYHRQIDLNLNSPSSILQLFQSKSLLQKGIKIHEKVMGTEKHLLQPNISDLQSLQSKPLNRMTLSQFKQLKQQRDFVPTAKLIFTTNKNKNNKKCKTSFSSQKSAEQPQLKITSKTLKDKDATKSRNRYNQYQCITQPSQSSFVGESISKKNKRSNFNLRTNSQSQNKSCKISVSDRKSFQNFISMSRCS